MTFPDDDIDTFDRAAVREDWSRHVRGEAAMLGRVRQSITESWQRSFLAGLDPYTHHAQRITDDELAARRMRHRDFLRAAGHAWEMLSESLLTTGSVFVLACPAGIMLEVKGNDELLASAERNAVGPGYDWSEARAGTNAIGTALATGVSTVVRTDEHYCVSAKIWDCAAGLVRDPVDGAVLGVVDITSLEDLSDKHTMALAITACRQIEQTLHSSELARSVQLLHWYRSPNSTWAGRASALIDRKGRVITLSRDCLDGVDAKALKIEVGNSTPHLAASPGVEIERIIPYSADEVEGTSWQGGVLCLRRIRGATSKRLSEVAQDPRPAPFRKIMTADPAMLQAIDQALRMAKSTAPVLITGETGCGKELFARVIHQSSSVANGRFVAVNCGTLTRELATSELLGYEPGAFTGAAARGRAGKFEEAHQGTLFLDEIGELPVDVQIHLLRVMQDGVVTRLGGNGERQVNVRIVAATNRDLTAGVRGASFRDDLYFRLSILKLALPPLRARPRDIVPLAEHFLRAMQDAYGLGPRWLSPELMQEFSRYSWPGNVRQLRGVIENMYVLGNPSLLTPADLPPDFRAVVAPLDGVSAPSAAAAPMRGDLRDVERMLVREALAAHDHNLSRTAQALGVARTTLYRKLREYGIARR